MDLGCLLDGLHDLGDLAVTRARLAAARIPATNGLTAKKELAFQCVQDLEFCHRLDSFLSEYFSQPGRKTIAWPDGILPLLTPLSSTTHPLEALDAVSASVTARSNDVASDLLGRSDTPMLEHCHRFIEREFPAHPSTRTPTKYDGSASWTEQEVSRAFRAPLVHHIDPVFKPTYSLRSAPQPGFRDNQIGAISYCWYLAIKECLAAELCALNVSEYDGLPLAFYRDMAKQCYDETRHACYFLHTSLRWLSERAFASDALSTALSELDETGTGLPIPVEGNFFETIHVADVAERLILMNAKTETIAIGKLKERLAGKLCAADPVLKLATEVDLQDEISHVRIGMKWLRFLIPEQRALNEKIADTMLIRGVLMLNTFAAVHSDADVGTMAKGLLSPFC